MNRGPFLPFTKIPGPGSITFRLPIYKAPLRVAFQTKQDAQSNTSSYIFLQSASVFFPPADSALHPSINIHLPVSTPTNMTSSKPRVHKDLHFDSYRSQPPDKPLPVWDMRYDPLDRNNKFNAPYFPYHFKYYGPRTTAVIPRVERLCILFRYHPSVPRYWAFDITHRGDGRSPDGFAVTCEDVLAGIYHQLRAEPNDEDRSFSKTHNQLAETARLERCALFRLDTATEPVRRIDYVKGVLGFCAFAGLDGYERHLATPRMRLYMGDVPRRTL